MTQFNYIKKPNWNNDGAITPTNTTAKLYASAHGWIAPIAGKLHKLTTSITAAGTGATTTVVQAGHALTVGLSVLITDAVPVGLNGYVTVLTVADANTFTYATLAAVVDGAATTQGRVAKNIEVVVALADLRNANIDAAVVPTFSAAVTAATGVITALVAGNILRCTLTATEAMEIQGAPKVQFVVGAAASVRQFTLNTTLTTGTSLVFDYVILATGDTSTAGQVVVTTATNGGYISDILPKNRRQLATVTFVAPSAATAVIA